MTDLSGLSSQEEGPASPKSAPQKGEFWFSVFECMEGKPKIDFDKLAERCHYKNAAVARVTYNNKRKALLQNMGVNPLPAPADGVKPKKRGRKPKEIDEDGEPPKKRGRGRPPKKKELVVVSVKDEETEAETEHEWEEEKEQYHY